MAKRRCSRSPALGGTGGAQPRASAASTDEGGATSNKPCGQGADGWQWDATKTKVLLCGPTCDKVKADDGGKIDIVVGCQTKVAPPPK